MMMMMMPSWSTGKVIARLMTMMNEGKIGGDNKPERNHTPTIYMRSSLCSTHHSSTHLPHMMRNANKQCYHHPCLMSLFRVFWLTMLLWCAVVDGLPLVRTATTSEMGDDVILVRLINYGTDGSILFSEEANLPQDLSDSEEANQSGEDEQELAAASYSPSSELKTLISPRMKKGLSYLSKYYSTAILNNINVNGVGGGGDTSSESSSHQGANRFFGVKGGSGSSTRSSSGEQRFPSIRRKLSFYPPVTTHSALMTPWSRFVGRPTTVRLRWGK